MYTDTNITLYLYGTGSYTRYVIGTALLPGVHWEDVKQSNINKSGLTSADSVSIYIPLANLPSGITADSFTGMKDIIVKGIVTDVIDTTSQATIGTSKNALLTKYKRMVTVQTVDTQTYGSIGMHHVQLSCK